MMKQEAMYLTPYFTQLAARPSWRWSGRVVEANGQTIEAEGPLCSVGECCEIVGSDGDDSCDCCGGADAGKDSECFR